MPEGTRDFFFMEQRLETEGEPTQRIPAAALSSHRDAAATLQDIPLSKSPVRLWVLSLGASKTSEWLKVLPGYKVQDSMCLFQKALHGQLCG